MLQTKILSSLHKVFPDFCPDYGKTEFTTLTNEPLSFQIAFRGTECDSRGVYVEIDKADGILLGYYFEEFSPVLRANGKPGMYPEMLIEKKVNPGVENKSFVWGPHYFEKGDNTVLWSLKDSWQSLWFTVNDRRTTSKPGKYELKIRFIDAITRDVLAENTVTVTVLPEKLPKQKLLYTCWFHCDCLADVYGEEVWSDRFFELVKGQVSTAADNGMNMILLPAFTPPLDTPVGSERKKVQLVKITAERGKYTFDFSLMKRFIDVCRKAGIEYFEHNHLFTQWGAAAAPNIYAFVGGKEKRIFGWDTPATGRKYSSFLKQYIPAVKEFFKAEKLTKKVLFHVSDEPSAKMLDSYKAAYGTVKELLKGYMTGDALSHYELYEQGLVKTPIVSTASVNKFYGKCKRFWCYYTGEQTDAGLSNRLVSSPSELNRMIGVQMYRHNIIGFLHWGYNNYYDVLSNGLYNPCIDPGCYRRFPGSSFYVYPGSDGKCIQSIRQKVFYEAINDVRALTLLEKKKGRKVADALIAKHFGEVTFFTKPDSPEQFLAFRDELNLLLAE